MFVLTDTKTSIVILEPCQTAIVLRKRQRHRQGHHGGARCTYPFLRVPDVCRRINAVILCHPRLNNKVLIFKFLRKSLIKLDAMYANFFMYFEYQKSVCINKIKCGRSLSPRLILVYAYTLLVLKVHKKLAYDAHCFLINTPYEGVSTINLADTRRDLHWSFNKYLESEIPCLCLTF